MTGNVERMLGISLTAGFLASDPDRTEVPRYALWLCALASSPVSVCSPQAASSWDSCFSRNCGSIVGM